MKQKEDKYTLDLLAQVEETILESEELKQPEKETKDEKPEKTYFAGGRFCS